MEPVIGDYSQSAPPDKVLRLDVIPFRMDEPIIQPIPQYPSSRCVCNHLKFMHWMEIGECGECDCPEYEPRDFT